MVGGAKFEDDYVDLKATWPDPYKAARLIAAMANASAGEQIIWIIGLDEGKHAVVPLDDTDAANWWAQAESKFADGTTPDLQVLVVPTDTGPVTCLHFETDRAPYMVKPEKEGAVTREIPWRTGTRTKSASRPEVLSMLLPQIKVPAMEPVEGQAEFHHVGDDPRDFVFQLDTTIFVDYPGTNIVLPRHRWSGTFQTANGVLVRMHSIRCIGEDDQANNRYGIVSRGAGLIVTGPDVFRVIARADVVCSLEEATEIVKSDWVDVDLSFHVNSTDKAAHVGQRLWLLPESDDDGLFPRDDTPTSTWVG
ncbi:helix-turn-helix domain-containing protein [Nocardia sp. CWNU-33]|uniref:AlbA family DNA-binding domain-containing protein n=1 Tax=Nocardia sp. CWNU-33 TaxID=3392117 RepID=UPI00398F7B58